MALPAGWWMPSDQNQESAKIDHSRPVQLQCFDCCPSGRRQPDGEGEVGTPGEMIMPMLLAGMKKRNRLSINRVGGSYFVVFMTVTAEACQRKIIWRRLPAATQRYDMLDGKRLGCIFGDGATYSQRP